MSHPGADSDGLPMPLDRSSANAQPSPSGRVQEGPGGETGNTLGMAQPWPKQTRPLVGTAPCSGRALTLARTHAVQSTQGTPRSRRDLSGSQLIGVHLVARRRRAMAAAHEQVALWSLGSKAHRLRAAMEWYPRHRMMGLAPGHQMKPA